MVDHTVHYREDYENIEVICEMDSRRAASHWTRERIYWSEELWRWLDFREIQRGYNEGGRSELDLELENTDVALVEALSKLNDWREFQSLHQMKLHEAEIFHEECQKEYARIQNAKVAIGSTRMHRIQEECGRLMVDMMEAQVKMEAFRKDLMWIKDQWKEVIAEACASIGAAPKLQEQLEAKIKMQTEAVYRKLLEKGARPSHTGHPPDMNVEFPQRLQHWISESFGLKAELWDWKQFRAWRRTKGAQTTGHERQEQLFVDETCSEIYEQLVEYRQYELDKAVSRLDGWRRQAQQYKEEKENSWLEKKVRYPAFLEGGFYGYSNDEDEVLKEETLEARYAEQLAMKAEKMVAVAATRLEQSKQKLQEILAEFEPQPAVEIPAETTDAQHQHTAETPAETSNAQPPPTLPKTPSPKLLPKNQSPPKKKHSTEKAHRRSKKKKARSLAPKPNTNTTATNQHPLPAFSPSEPPHPNKDADTEMSDEEAQGTSAIQALVDEEVNQTDAVMSDIGDPSPPPSPSQPNPQKPPSRTLRSATRAKHAPPAHKILKDQKVLKNTPPPPQRRKKSRTFTEAQMTALLDAASKKPYSDGSITTLRRSERLKGKGAAAGAGGKGR